MFSRSGQRHRLSFSLLFFSLHFFFFFFASWPGCCACTLDTRVLVSLCALLKRMWKLVALFCHLHPSTSFSKRKDLCQHAQRPACVCVCVSGCVCARVCVCVCICVYIYKKERVIFMNLFFSYFVMRAIDKKQKENKVLFLFFFLSGTLPYYFEGKHLFSWNLDYE